MVNLKFNSAIRIVLTQVHPECQLSADGYDFMNKILNAIVNRMSDYLIKKHPTVLTDEIIDELLLTFLSPKSELTSHAKREVKATQERPERLTFKFSIYGYTPINEAVNAILEYISAETLELGGNRTRGQGKVRINEEFLMMAIKDDTELMEMYEDLFGDLITPTSQVTFDVKGKPEVVAIVNAMLQLLLNKLRNIAEKARSLTPSLHEKLMDTVSLINPREDPNFEYDIHADPSLNIKSTFIRSINKDINRVLEYALTVLQGVAGAASVNDFLLKIKQDSQLREFYKSLQ